MSLKQHVKELIIAHFGLEVETQEDVSETKYLIKSPTGRQLLVIPVQFKDGKATVLATSEGTGHKFLRSAIDNSTGDHEPHAAHRNKT